jgi:hypothetical protein
MRNHWRIGACLRFAGFTLCLSMLLGTLGAVKLYAQSDEEFDTYKIRVSAYWVYSHPSGTLQGSDGTQGIDLNYDLGFNTYSTFAGKFDWKFTHKNHLYIVGIPYNSSRQTVLLRTITFQGQTFTAGSTTRANLESPMYGFGYQYDIIRRRRGHLGIGAQINLYDSHASISAEAQTVNGVPYPAVHASGSLLAPIPVAGPDFRLYLTNSPRVFIEGNLYGMYFFGYGNYVSSAGDLGFTLTHHLTLNAGYQLGSRLVVNNDASTNRIGLTLKQKGPMVGLQFSF